MKIEFTNEDLTKARVITGRLWWRLETVVVRCAKDEYLKNRDGHIVRWRHAYPDPVDNLRWHVDNDLNDLLEAKRAWQIIWRSP